VQEVKVRSIKVVSIAVFALALATTMVAAEEYTYIGAAKCKMCHKVSFASWSETPHAMALDKLEEADKGKAECLKCHATGGSADMPGVQCEACHGPGSGYKSMKVMKDPEASRAAGLIEPDEAVCRSCHEGAPHDQPEFNYEEAKKTGLHEFEADE
jgi:nitrate/TMAO reductase-like tetraheme cytochrome c subunit